MMAQKSVLAKVFQENSALNNPYLKQSVVHSLVPVMKQYFAKAHKDEDCDCECGCVFDDEVIQQFIQISMQSLSSNTAIQMMLTQAELLQQCEIMIKQELFNSGIKTIGVSALESKKLMLLCQRIKNGDKAALLLVQYCGQYVCQEDIGTPVDHEEYLELSEVVKHSLLSVLEIMSQNQQHLAVLAVLRKTIGNYYLEEASTTLSEDAVISYDPLFSLPRGVQPSAVLKIRLERWAMSESAPPKGVTKNDFVLTFILRLVQTLPQYIIDEQVPIIIKLSQHQPSITLSFHPDPLHLSTDVTISSPKMFVPSISSKTHQNVPLSENILSHTEMKLLITNVVISSDFICISRLIKEVENNPLSIKGTNGTLYNYNSYCEEKGCILSTDKSTHAHSLCWKCTSVISGISNDNWVAISLHSLGDGSIDSVRSSLTSFAMGLLACSDVDTECIQISIKFSKHLLRYNLPQLSIPLLITILEHSTLGSIERREVYLLLVATMKQIMQQGNTSFLQSWFLQAACDHFSQLISDNGSLNLPSLKTSLRGIFDHLLKAKADDLVKLAVENVNDSVPFRCILTQLLALQRSDPSLSPINDDHVAAINLLSGINEIDTNPDASFEFLVKAIWQSSKFHFQIAKVVVILFPELVQQKFIFQPKMISINKPCPLLGQNDPLLLRQENAIEEQVSSRKIRHSQAAMWYLDLMENSNLVCCQPKKVFCLLRAAIHFEHELLLAKLVPDKVALKNAALTCVYDAWQLATELHPGMRVFTFQIALEITLRLGTADYTVPTKQCLDAILAAGMFKNLVYNRQFTYLWNIPAKAIHVSCAHFLSTVSYFAHKAYLQILMELDESILPLKSSLLYYQCFENALTYDRRCGIESESSILNQRRTVMHEFLSEKGLTFQDVSDRMNSPHLPRDSEGWLVPHKSLGQHLQIAELKGFCLDISDDSPAIKLLIEPAKDGNGLLSFQDVFDILHLESDEVFPIRFSLDPPSTTERLHPFFDVRCHPNKLINTDYMDTLLQADYLLKKFSTGTEVSSNPPFNLRPVQKNLIKDLSEDLQYILRPCHVRGYSRMSEHRFWIEAEEILFDHEVSQDLISYYIPKVKLVVCSRPLVRGVNGQCYDAIHTDSGPDAEFAATFTKHYDEISEHFPVFARLGELAKLQFMMQKLYDLLNSLEKSSSSKYKILLSEVDRLRSLAPIKNSKKACNWVPAVYTIGGCTCMVHGGVTLQPSHKKYYGLVGNDCPDSEKQFSWVDVYNNLINPAKGLEVNPGGIYFGLQRHCRVPIHVTEPDNIICVKLGSTTSGSSSSSSVKGDSVPRISPQIQTSLNEGLMPQKSTVVSSQDEQPSPIRPVKDKTESVCKNDSLTLLHQNPLEDELYQQSDCQSSQQNSCDKTLDPTMNGNTASYTEPDDEPKITDCNEDELNDSMPNASPTASHHSFSSCKGKNPAELLSPLSSPLGPCLTSRKAGEKEEQKISNLMHVHSPSQDQMGINPVDSSLEIQHEHQLRNEGRLHDPEMRSLSIETGDISSNGRSSSPTALLPNEINSISTTSGSRSNEHTRNLLNEDMIQTPGGAVSPSGTDFTPFEIHSPMPQDQQFFNDSSLQRECNHQNEIDSHNSPLNVDNDLGGSLSSFLMLPVNIQDDSSQELVSSKSSEEAKDKTCADNSTSRVEITPPQALSEIKLPTSSLAETSDSVENSASHDNHATNHTTLSNFEEMEVLHASAKSSASKDRNYTESHPIHAINLSALHDSCIHSFSESPFNVAVFGKIMQNAGMNLSTSSKTLNVNMTNFHPSLLVREQVKNVIVLKRIIDACQEQGIELHILSQ